MLAIDCGRRELGKTTLALHLAQRWPSQIILDPRRMFRATEPVVNLPDEEDAILDVIERGAGAVVIQPTDDETALDLARVVKNCVDYFPGQRFAVLLDEAGTYKTAINAPAWLWNFKGIAREHVLFVLTCHRPTDIPPNVRGLADDFFWFRATLPADLETIAEHCGADVADDVAQLRAREFVRWDDAHGRASIYRESSQWFAPLDVRARDRRAPSQVNV